jgi:hypothetical protein
MPEPGTTPPAPVEPRRAMHWRARAHAGRKKTLEQLLKAAKKEN